MLVVLNVDETLFQPVKRTYGYKRRAENPSNEWSGSSGVQHLRRRQGWERQKEGDTQTFKLQENKTVNQGFCTRQAWQTHTCNTLALRKKKQADLCVFQSSPRPVRTTKLDLPLK